MTKPASQQEKFVIRFPDGMRDEIAKAAARSGRSMNAEIVYRLERSLQLSEMAESAVRSNIFTLSERVAALEQKLFSNSAADRSDAGRAEVRKAFHEMLSALSAAKGSLSALDATGAEATEFTEIRQRLGDLEQAFRYLAERFELEISS